MTDWRDDAACLNEDPELFFPIGETHAALAQAAEAKEVCAVCDVRTTCLAWAMDTNQGDGIWGGLTEKQRAAIRRRDARAAKGKATS